MSRGGSARHAQRTPLPPKGSTGLGNPAAEIIKAELARLKQLASQRNVG